MAFHLTKPQVWGVMPCCQVTTSVGQFLDFTRLIKFGSSFFQNGRCSGYGSRICSQKLKPIGFRVESNFVTNGFRSDEFSFYKNLGFWVGFSLSMGMVQKLIF